MNKNIPDIYDAIAKILSDLEGAISKTSVSDRPEVIKARKKLLDMIQKEVSQTSDLATSSRLANPLIKQLRNIVPDMPSVEDKDETK